MAKKSSRSRSKGKTKTTSARKKTKSTKKKKRTASKSASKIIGDGAKASEPVDKDKELVPTNIEGKTVMLPRALHEAELKNNPPKEKQPEMPADAFENDTNINEGVSNG